MPLISPSLVLGVLVGLFWTWFAVLVTGVAGARLPFVIVLAILGAWAGDALGARLGIELLRIGDFRLLAASVGAWAGIGLVVLVSILGPTRTAGPGGASGPGGGR
jgi:hypothetical protein